MNDGLFSSMILVLLAHLCLQKQLVLVPKQFYRISEMSLESNIIALSEELWKVVLSHYTFKADDAGNFQCPVEHCK